MSKIRKWIVIPVLCLSFSIPLLAWDPAGTWGIEGRTDATFTITKVDDHYVVNVNTAYSKQKSIGYLYQNQLIVAYVVLTETQCGFEAFTRLDDNRMSAVSMNTEGTVGWKGVLVRK